MTHAKSMLHQDLFETDASKATVVTIYLLSETVNRLEANGARSSWSATRGGRS